MPRGGGTPVTGCAAFLAFLAAFLLLSPISALYAGENPQYSIAVIPSGTPEATTAEWTPFVESLSRETGLSFHLETYAKFSDFENAFGKGTPDFLFAHPVQTVSARKAQGYIPLVRGSRKIAAVLFTRDDSPIRSAKNLQGEKIAMVGSRNVCSILMRQELSSGEKLRFNTCFLGSVAKVVQSVLDDETAAGTVLDTALEAVPPEARARLRVIGSTPAFFPHPLSAHPRVPTEARDTVTAAVLKIGEGSEGRGILEVVRLADPVKADYEADYKPLESIDNKILSVEE